jgi:hypothetical protein
MRTDWVRPAQIVWGSGLKYQITIVVERVVLAKRSLADEVSYGASPERDYGHAVIVCQRGSKIASTHAVPLDAGLGCRV